MDLPVLGLPDHDVGQEGHELLTGMASGGLAMNLAGLSVERGVERESAVTDVLETVPLRPARRQGQNRIFAVQRLDGRFLVHAKHHGMLRGIEIEPDHIGAEGTLVNSWGGPGDGYVWPTSGHGIVVDHMDNVWIGGNGGDDSHVLKFSRAGDFLLQVGEAGHTVPNSNALNHFSRVAKVTFDGPANEMYLADGYGNRRVAVIDATTGDIKRFWGAYGNVPHDDNLGAYDPNMPKQQFRSPVHCADPTPDGFVYVCDRSGDRIQVFQKDGTFVEETFIEQNTLGAGAVWDIAFSPDPAQSFIYVADGMNEKVHVLRREGLEYIYNFGDGGRMAGQFYGTHSIATDSQGNIYTTETYEGKRVQKHTYMGMGPAPSGSIGVARPE